jgi:hypothetical protein
MRPKASFSGSVLVLLLAAFVLMNVPVLCQEAQTGDVAFPSEGFVQINPTLPNANLNFQDDSQESCCAKDYPSTGQALQTGASSGNAASLPRSEFEKSNPRYLENSTPAYLVTCERFADLPEPVANTSSPVADLSDFTPMNSLPIESYSTNVSLRQNAKYYSNPDMHTTSDFHVETAGGGSQVKLRDVNSYSLCMGGGNNVAVVANTDNGSILTYNGNDHIVMGGQNTNMLTRTGAGDDVIELAQASPVGASQEPSAAPSWASYNIYKTAISGGTGTDNLVLTNTPPGTKWCHIGGYKVYGEYFYVIEFALPPSVTEGPRRQRMSIGESVEYVVIKGKRYRLNDFLVHAQPVDPVARSIPLNDPLPRG